MHGLGNEVEKLEGKERVSERAFAMIVDGNAFFEWASVMVGDDIVFG